MAWPLPEVVEVEEVEAKDERDELPAQTRLDVLEATTPNERAASNFLTS